MTYVPPNNYMHNQYMNPENPYPRSMSSQTSPSRSEINNLRYALRSKTSHVRCPYCRHEGLTRVDGKCNVVDGLFCLFTLGTIWSMIHFCRGKDLNCTDADHYCTSCNVKLGEYSSC